MERRHGARGNGLERVMNEGMLDRSSGYKLMIMKLMFYTSDNLHKRSSANSTRTSLNACRQSSRAQSLCGLIVTKRH